MNVVVYLAWPRVDTDAMEFAADWGGAIPRVGDKVEVRIGDDMVEATVDEVVWRIDAPEAHNADVWIGTRNPKRVDA